MHCSFRDQTVKTFSWGFVLGFFFWGGGFFCSVGDFLPPLRFLGKPFSSHHTKLSWWGLECDGHVQLQRGSRDFHPILKVVEWFAFLSPFFLYSSLFLWGFIKPGWHKTLNLGTNLEAVGWDVCYKISISACLRNLCWSGTDQYLKHWASSLTRENYCELH